MNIPFLLCYNASLREESKSCLVGGNVTPDLARCLVIYQRRMDMRERLACAMCSNIAVCVARFVCDDNERVNTRRIRFTHPELGPCQ